ncbi:ABC transporter permease [Nonomuraea soli]|uniref:ABC-2 type transport system permease protein n=1 Tax=Nonomuraea soli TaxID=1032476 RepID=A0A7W0HPV0_9ACTN|nr:ABC transporter permease [Nonomuraea soli]MBA2891248.1 ABC-2 type transport system permease protein [Nonomuraea soli]
MIFFAAMRHQMALMRASWQFLVLLGVLQPVVYLLIVLSSNPTAATVTAVMLMSFWGSTVWSGAGILRREKMEGTLAPTMLGVRDPRLVLLGKTTGASLLILVVISATVSLFLLLSGHAVVIAMPFWFAVGLALVAVTGTAAGFLLSCLFLLSRYGPQLSALAVAPVTLLSGLLIPVSVLPGWIQPLSWVINLRWVQEFLGGAARGAPDFTALGLGAVLTVVYFVLGAVAFERVAVLARKEGTLDLS